MSDKPQTVVNTAKTSVDSLNNFVKEHWGQLSSAESKHTSMTFSSLLNAERNFPFSKEEKNMLTLLESNTNVIGMLATNQPGEISQASLNNLAEAAHGKLDPYKAELMNLRQHEAMVCGLTGGAASAAALLALTLLSREPLPTISTGRGVGLFTTVGFVYGCAIAQKEYKKYYEPNLRSLMGQLK